MTNVLLSISIGLLILSFAILGLQQIAYGLGFFVGGINSIFNSFQYIGADCVLITTVQTIFYTFPPILLALYMWHNAKS